MGKKIGLGIVAALVIFLAYVSTRNGHFHYERSGIINAPVTRIFPVISNFKMGSQWNPYDQKDPNMKRNFSGVDGAVGSKMEFEGNAEAGSGWLEITKIEPNSFVEIHLHMTKPFVADNTIMYRLTSEGTGIRFSWAMEGDGGFLGKLISVFIDCEKMMTKDFDAGIANLKKLAEAQ